MTLSPGSQSSIEPPTAPASPTRVIASAACGGLGPVAVLQVHRHRQLGRAIELRCVLDDLVERHLAVLAPEPLGVAGAGRSQRLEAESVETDRGVDVPRVREDERLAGVERAERLGLLGLAHATILSAAEVTSRSQSSSKSIPAASAAIGKSEVSVRPGTAFTSSTSGPSSPRIRSTRTKPAQSSASQVATAVCGHCSLVVAELGGADEVGAADLVARLVGVAVLVVRADLDRGKRLALEHPDRELAAVDVALEQHAVVVGERRDDRLRNVVARRGEADAQRRTRRARASRPAGSRGAPRSPPARRPRPARRTRSARTRPSRAWRSRARGAPAWPRPCRSSAGTPTRPGRCRGCRGSRAAPGRCRPRRRRRGARRTRRRAARP